MKWLPTPSEVVSPALEQGKDVRVENEANQGIAGSSSTPRRYTPRGQE